MKNTLKPRCYSFFLRRLVLMKALLLVLFLSVLQANMIVRGQKVTLKLTNSTVEEALLKVSKQVNKDLIYDSQLIKNSPRVFLTLEDASLEDAMASIFRDQPFEYEIQKNTIVVLPKKKVEKIRTESVSIVQQKGVSGRVVDGQNGPLAGVTISVKGTTVATTSDENGSFSLSVSTTAKALVFSMIGFESIEAQVPASGVINVTLKELVGDLDEVVVVGYGTVRKSDLTGAVSTVDGKDISARKTTQVSQALQGAIPGVMVTRNNNAPGSAGQIRVRGITTITEAGMNPLVIVDGVPVSSVDQVNPNDIESLTVLKDAASASIYGARAAAGVILITTKRGVEGKVSLEYNTDIGFEKPTELPDYVNTTRYMELVNELRWNDNNNNENRYPTYAKDLIDNYLSLNRENPNQYPMTDWQSLIIKDNAFRHAHQLSVSGAGKHLRTRFSLGYDDTDALHVLRNYERLTTRINNNVTITNFLSAVVDFSYKRTTDNRPSVDPMYRVGITAPIYAAMWDDGRLGAGKDGDNIYGMLTQGGETKYQYNQLGGKIALDLKPIDGLTLTGAIAPIFNFDKTKAFRKKVTYTGWNDPERVIGNLNGYGSTKLDESRGDSHEYTVQLLANYVNSFKKHNINLLAGYESYRYFNESLGASRDQYILNNYPYLNIGPLEYRDNSGSAYENAYRSYFGRAMYNYANKYFIQGNIRYDGSSRFAPEHRWGVFPSVSAGWTITEENFMKSVSWLNFLKLRASYGTLGNERIGNYPYQSIIEFSNASLFYKGGLPVSEQAASQWQYAIRDISWEKTESYDIGLDVSALNSRLTGSFDVYKKVTNDMLLALQIPEFIGFDNPNQNTGKMRTNGWDLIVGWKDRKNDFTYGLSVNLQNFKSVMGDLGGTEFLGDQIKRQGSEFNEWYGYVSDGIYQTQADVDNSAKLNSNVKVGDIRYKDISGPNGVPDGVISPAYDRVLLGGSLPKYLYGGQVNLGYKGIGLNLVFQGVGKQNTRQSADMMQPFRENWGNFLSVLDGNTWSHYNTEEQNRKAKYPRYSSNSASNNYTMSDFWIINGGYFRLKTVNVSYEIPESFLAKYHIKGMGLSVTMNDLFTANKYPKGWDPEMTSFAYPITSSFLFGMNLKF